MVVNTFIQYIFKLMYICLYKNSYKDIDKSMQKNIYLLCKEKTTHVLIHHFLLNQYYEEIRKKNKLCTKITTKKKK